MSVGLGRLFASLMSTLILTGCNSSASNFVSKFVPDATRVRLQSGVSPAPIFTTYPLPGSLASTQWITLGSDGALWFTETFYPNPSKIGRISVTGAVSEFALPAPFTGLGGIASGPDGALWITETDKNKIARLSTSGAVIEYSIPTGASGASGISTGPDGALWFSESYSGNLGRITTAGAITEKPVGSGCMPQQLTTGPDGAVWFTEPSCLSVGRMTIDGTVTQFNIGMQANGLVTGPDKNLWLTINRPDAIEKMTTAGVLTNYPATRYANPTGITLGGDGALWFTENTSYGGIGRITPSGVLTEFLSQVNQANGNFWGIAATSDGSLWFPEKQFKVIGRAMPAAVPTPTPFGGLLESTVKNVKAAVGGSLSLSSGAALAVSPNSIAGDSTIEFDRFGSGTQAPINPALHTVGSGFEIKFSAPSSAPAAAPFNSVIRQSSSVAPICPTGLSSGLGGALITLSVPLLQESLVDPTTGIPSITVQYADGSLATYALRIETDGVSIKIYIPRSITDRGKVAAVAVEFLAAAEIQSQTGVRVYNRQDGKWYAAAPSDHRYVGHPLLLLHGIGSTVEETFPPVLINDIMTNGGYDTVFGYDYNWLDTPDNISSNIASAVNQLNYPILDIMGHSYGAINAMALIPKLTSVKQIQNLVLIQGPLNGALINDPNYLASWIVATHWWATPQEALTLSQLIVKTMNNTNCAWYNQFNSGGFASIETAMENSPNAPIRVIKLAGDTPPDGAQAAYQILRGQAMQLPNDGVILTSSETYSGSLFGKAPTESQFPGASIAHVEVATELKVIPGASHATLLGDDKDSPNNERSWIPFLQVSLANGYFQQSLKSSTGLAGYGLLKGAKSTVFASLSGQVGKSFSAEIDAPTSELPVPPNSAPEAASSSSLSASTSLVFTLLHPATNTDFAAPAANFNLQVPDAKGKKQNVGTFSIYALPDCLTCLRPSPTNAPPVYLFSDL